MKDGPMAFARKLTMVTWHDTASQVFLTLVSMEWSRQIYSSKKFMMSNPFELGRQLENSRPVQGKTHAGAAQSERGTTAGRVRTNAASASRRICTGTRTLHCQLSLNRSRSESKGLQQANAIGSQTNIESPPVCSVLKSIRSP